MTDSPLFPRFNKLIREQQAALRQWIQTQKAKSRGGYRSSQPMRYSKRPGDGNWLWNQILSKLGPLGSIVDAMLRPNGQNLAPDVQKELEAAAKLLESFGYDVNQRGSTIADVVRELVEEAPKEAIETPKPEPDRRPDPQQQPDEPARGTKQAEERSEGLVEGMIPVTSSNVHSIGYSWNPNPNQPGDLLVRFLAGTGKHRGGPGALYRYKGVPREIFDAFKRASSKGRFVWDELRMRGTVAGEQYSTDLIGTGNSDYVPRRAVVGKRGVGGTAFVKRSFKGRQSQKPDHQIRGRALTKDFRGEAKRVDFKRSTRNR